MFGLGLGIKAFLRSLIAPFLYIGGIITIFGSLRKPYWGLCLMVFLIPQPNVWHKFYEYPLGGDFMDFLFMAIFIGILLNYQRRFFFGQNSILIIVLIISSYFSLMISSSNFHGVSAMDISNPVFRDWKNYAMMISLYILTFMLCREYSSQKIMTLIICLAVLIVSVRSLRNFSPGDAFSYGNRAGGPFWAVGLISNHFAAFLVDYAAVFAGLFFFDDNNKRKWLYFFACSFAMYPILFTYSRGAYMASFIVIFIIGVLKKRSLLIALIVVFIGYAVILPPTVVERISMTENEQGELDSSAGARLKLWESAIAVYEKNPIVGVGFDGFALSGGGVDRWTDTHNYFLKKLCEEGIIGFSIFLFCLFKALLSGWKLYRYGGTSFHKGLGLGFIACVFSIMVTNLFGNRFSYFVVGSYFFIFWALVDSSLMLLRHPEGESYMNGTLPRNPIIRKFIE